MKFTICVILFALLIAARTNPNVNHAEVNQLQGVYIFTDSKPVQDYEYLGTVKTGIGFNSGQYQPVRDLMIKKIKKQYPNADGAIFYFNDGNADRCDAIKFK